ncbi:MAG: hypothetical protein J7L95_01820 [Prolixibacteraceae bacterium]|nr:hypothetical protein [Prolixibacteraceae bacterium]
MFFLLQFAIIFPAFTGITAGVGLSGDLKNPSRAIPLGTTLATIVGMVIFFFYGLQTGKICSCRRFAQQPANHRMNIFIESGLLEIQINVAKARFNSQLFKGF